MTARHSRTRHRTRPPKPAEGFLSSLIDPIDRLSETIYSILILLTFTLAFRLYKLATEPSVPAGDYIVELFFAALGASLAWGVIDGIMYVLTEFFARGERRRLLWHIQAAEEESEAVEAIADELDFILEPITSEGQRELLYADILDHLRESEAAPVRLKKDDFWGALACVFVALYSVAPSLLPLWLLSENVMLALRVSNVISFTVLFVSGFQWGRYTGASPWKTGALLVVVGLLLVAIAVTLGG